jgi:translocation and assembly module TamB
MDKPTAAPPAVPAHRRLAPRAFATAGWLVLASIVAGALALLWVLTSASGTAWLLAHVPGVQVLAPRGALLDGFDADRVELVIGDDRLRIEGLAWRRPRIGVGPRGTWLRLSFDELRAARVTWQGGPSKTASTPAQAPADLRTPIALDVAHLHLDTLRFGSDATAMLRDLDATVHLGGDDGRVHRVERLALTWERLHMSASVRIATQAPFDLEARLDAAQPAAGTLPALQGDATARGPLAALQVEAHVRTPAAAAEPPQRLDLAATVRPFAAWPLGDVSLALADFDMSALAAGWPLTRLSGRAEVRSQGLDRPASATLQIVNARPGRWNEGRVPVRSLRATLGARPDDLQSLDVGSASAVLGDGSGEAGRIDGTGRWSTRGWSLEAVLVNLAPQRLDARAPAWQLGGRVRARSEAPAGPTAGPTANGITLQAALDGRIAERGPLRAVQLEFDAGIAGDRIAVRRARARVAEATLLVEGRAERSGRNAEAWHSTGRLELTQLDPSRFGAWPAPSDPRASSRIDATLRFDLEATPPSRGDWLDWIGALRGSADLVVGDSRLAGMPVQGGASFRHAATGPASVDAHLEAGGNRARIEGRFDRTGDDDAWQALVDAPEVASLEPLARAFATSGAPQAAGRLHAEGQLRGRWPSVQTEGRVDANDVRLGPLRLAAARAAWSLDTRSAGPMKLDAELRDAAVSGRVLQSLQASLSGTAASHHLDVQASANGLPPAWVDALQPAAPARPPTGGSRAVLRVEGSLLTGSGPAPTPLAANGWRGRVETLDLRPEAADAAPWLHAEAIAIELHNGDRPLSLAVAPGRIALLGSGVRWSRLEWTQAASATPARVEVDAELEPLAVAPVLRRAQPAFGWGGDLVVAGHASIHGSGAGPKADVVLERRSGDLSVTDETGTQALGLTDLRVALQASGGVFSLTQAFAGRTLGAASGSLVARVPAGGTWPTAATPIDGGLELRVSDLGVWSVWVPPGWRVGGTLHASAHLGGRLGAPDATGRITGSALSLRNFAEGVAIADGELAIALQGTRAQLEQFTARAGDGSLRGTGEATLGAAPQARLELHAERFQVLGRVDRRIVASGDAKLAFDGDRIGLQGRVAVDEGLVDFSHAEAPTLGDDVHVVRRRPPPPPAPGTPEAALAQRTAREPTSPAAPARALDLDLRVDMGQRLHIHGHGLDANLRGELHMTSPDGRLAVAGTVYTVDGTYQAYGQNLTIERGQLVFAGSIADPRLDIEATRPNLDVRVGVAVTGTALNPRVRLFSEPDMTDIEKVSWLVLGRASQGVGQDDAALLQHAALALMAGEGSGGGSSLTKRIGLDAVSLSQGTPGDMRSTIVGVGKQISQRWYVGYERGLNATTGSWQLIYRAARRVTVRVESGEDTALDVIWTWRWQ